MSDPEDTAVNEGENIPGGDLKSGLPELKPDDQQSAGQIQQTSSPGESRSTPRTATDLHAVFDVPVKVSAVLGRTNMEVSDLMKLEQGAIVELDRKVGEPIDIYINERLVARGEVVIVENRLGVTMTEIIKTD